MGAAFDQGGLGLTTELPNLSSPSHSTSITVVSNQTLARRWIAFPQAIAAAMMDFLRYFLAILALPFTFTFSLFYDNDKFSPVLPFVRLLRLIGLMGKPQATTPNRSKHTFSHPSRPEGETTKVGPRKPIPTSQGGLLAKMFRRNKAASAAARAPGLTEGEVSAIKSPSSPCYTALMKQTRYPIAPSIRRPLVPKRQPSFSHLPPPEFSSQTKSLILDLDETLIHSRPKGNSILSNHVIEVYSSHSDVAGNAVPVLFSVNKRPYCDEFLRKASKWYKLYAFTASTQAYADQLIDWLENEGKYFSGRLYRQHCKYTEEGFVKDISQVEPDLSKVMILDNTPISYSSHEDNGIPISGWIDDQSDKSLLQLIPLLEGLQHVPDVRAFLGLRMAEIQAL